MKAIIKTTGRFQLICPTTDQIVPHHRPAVVEVSPFFFARIGIGQLEVVEGNLPPIANDKEFVVAIKEAEGDIDKAVADYMLTLAALTAPTEDQQEGQRQDTEPASDGDPPGVTEAQSKARKANGR